MKKRYTVVTFPNEVHICWRVHKLGCPEIKKETAAGARKEMARLNLESSDDDLLEDIGADYEATIEDVDLCACTGYENDEPKPAKPSPPPAAAKASQEAAARRLLRATEETIDKLIVKRGTDDIGLGDKWSDLRLESCTDDYVYDLAVEVRKLRERGEAWWRVAYELGLPGSGASNKQGRKGSAFARRLWRAAWGKTYLGERGQRESKLTRELRAMENLGRSYFSEADEDHTIAETIRGQMLHWVARLEGTHGLITSAQEAYVHDDPRLVRVKQGPQGRYVEFYEQLDPSMLMVDPRRAITKSGPLRAVYVDRITRVGV